LNKRSNNRVVKERKKFCKRYGAANCDKYCFPLLKVDCGKCKVAEYVYDLECGACPQPRDVGAGLLCQRNSLQLHAANPLRTDQCLKFDWKGEEMASLAGTLETHMTKACEGQAGTMHARPHRTLGASHRHIRTDAPTRERESGHF